MIFFLKRVKHQAYLAARQFYLFFIAKKRYIYLNKLDFK
jgi:hypothetical protein